MDFFVGTEGSQGIYEDLDHQGAACEGNTEKRVGNQVH